jgi:hypothetical protein
MEGRVVRVALGALKEQKFLVLSSSNGKEVPVFSTPNIKHYIERVITAAFADFSNFSFYPLPFPQIFLYEASSIAS